MHEKRQMLKQRKDQLLQAKQYALGQHPHALTPQPFYPGHTMPSQPVNPPNIQYPSNFSSAFQHINSQASSNQWNMRNMPDVHTDDNREYPNPFIGNLVGENRQGSNEIAKPPLFNNFSQNQLPNVSIDPHINQASSSQLNISFSNQLNQTRFSSSNNSEQFSNDKFGSRFPTDMNNYQHYNNLNRPQGQSNGVGFPFGQNNQSNSVETERRNSLPMPTDIINKYANAGNGRINDIQSEQSQDNRFQFNKLMPGLNNRLPFNYNINNLSNEGNQFRPDNRFAGDPRQGFPPNVGNNRFPMDEGNNLPPDLSNRFPTPVLDSQSQGIRFASQKHFDIDNIRFSHIQENQFANREENNRLPPNHGNLNRSLQPEEYCTKVFKNPSNLTEYNELDSNYLTNDNIVCLIYYLQYF